MDGERSKTPDEAVEETVEEESGVLGAPEDVGEAGGVCWCWARWVRESMRGERNDAIRYSISLFNYLNLVDLTRTEMKSGKAGGKRNTSVSNSGQFVEPTSREWNGMSLYLSTFNCACVWNFLNFSSHF